MVIVYYFWLHYDNEQFILNSRSFSHFSILSTIIFEISRWIHDIFVSVHEFKFVWVWLSLIHYLLSKFTMNLPFSAILLSYLLFFLRFHYKSIIFFVNLLWIHYRFDDFTMDSQSLLRFRHDFLSRYNFLSVFRDVTKLVTVFFAIQP